MGKTIVALCLWFIWSFHGCLFFINKIILTRQRFCLCHNIRGGEDLGKTMVWRRKLLKRKIRLRISDCSTCHRSKYTSPNICMLKVDLLVDYWWGYFKYGSYTMVWSFLLWRCHYNVGRNYSTNNWGIWRMGNPNVKDIIKSYSPYDNVKPQAYPNMYISTGLHDSQVQYWAC
jgi:oligopeptidase B